MVSSLPQKQIWIRVRFIENPWYDNHFDLDHDLLKLGKTLVSVARGNNDLIGRSYQLIGLALYEKFETGLKLLRDCIKLGAVPVVTQEAVSVGWWGGGVGGRGVTVE